MGIKQVNAKLAKEGYCVEVVKGEGYFYFCFDDGSWYETESEYVCYFKSMPDSRWFDLAKAFYATQVTERDSYKAEPLVFNRWGGV